jgi:hypothetical protein
MSQRTVIDILPLRRRLSLRSHSDQLLLAATLAELTNRKVAETKAEVTSRGFCKTASRVRLEWLSTNAGVVKLADAPDSKSGGVYPP